MECCQATQRPPYCLPRNCPAELDLASAAAAARDFLRYLVTPEASNRQGPQPGPARGVWTGAVKTLLWTALATAAGIALALVCN